MEKQQTEIYYKAHFFFHNDVTKCDKRKLRKIKNVLHLETSE